MNTYAYEAVNTAGRSSSGIIEVASQSEAVRRIKEMGLFPTRVAERRPGTIRQAFTKAKATAPGKKFQITLIEPRIKPAAVATLTRQMATLVEAGLPLLRGLQLLAQQETHPRLKRILGEIGASIEGGALFSEALAAHPKVFNRLYLNMVRAGELSGALDVALVRLAEFMEKVERIKNKIKSAMFYPCAVLFVATGVTTLLLVYVIPKFREVFAGLTGNTALPGFTTFVLNLSDLARHHAPIVALALATFVTLFLLALRTNFGRLAFDRFKLKLPVLGPVFRKSAISRFARTFGTLLGSGVPILQALQIVRETAGNLVVGRLIASVHDAVKEGEPITASLRHSNVFPPMVVGMVDIGEQTGALPDMLMKVAEGYDDEVDNSISAMTSLIEPIMLVFLAIVVGSIVIAMFLPIIGILNGPISPSDADV